MTHHTTCARGARRILGALHLSALLAACTDARPRKYTPEVIEGLPPATGLEVFERGDGDVWIAVSGSDEGLFWSLGPDTLDAEPVVFAEDPPEDAAHSYLQLQVGPRAFVPALRTFDGRVWWLDPDTDAFVSRAPGPPVIDSPPLADQVVWAPWGQVLYVNGGVLALNESTDAWELLVEPAVGDFRSVTLWDDRLILLSTDTVGELHEDGTYDVLAACTEDCEDLNWGRFHTAANGDLWIQHNWRWWSFDGESIASIGPMPNPDVYGESVYISQVQSTVIDRGRVLTMNREDYSTTTVDLLSWAPGQKDAHDHDFSATGGLRGSHESSIVGVPIVAAVGLYVLR